MPAESVTLAGGAVLHTYLATPNTDLAANAINNLLGVFDTLPMDLETSIPSHGATPITNILSATGPESYALTSKTGGSVLADATDFNDTLSVNQGTAGVNYTLVGNDANDTFNIGSNSATVITGAGDNFINVGKNGAVDVVQDGGSAVVNFAGGTSVLEQQGYFNSPGINPAKLTVFLGAGGTLYVPQVVGNDTINALGSATVYGGRGSFVFEGDNGANSTVHTGVGSETLFGGSGSVTNLFDASGDSTSSNDSLVGGGGNASNTFIGGVGNDTMVSGYALGAKSDIFEFNASVGGGTHTIQGFGGTDVIDLVGYGSSIPSSDIVFAGGNTTITLGDNTKIVITGFNATNQIEYNK